MVRTNKYNCIKQKSTHRVLFFGMHIFDRLWRNPPCGYAASPPLQGGLRFCNQSASLVKGDSPQCGEMSRSDRGDGHRFGGGNAVRH